MRRGQVLLLATAFGLLSAVAVQAEPVAPDVHMRAGHAHPAVIVHRRHRPHPLLRRHHYPSHHVIHTPPEATH